LVNVWVDSLTVRGELNGELNGERVSARALVASCATCVPTRARWAGTFDLVVVGRSEGTWMISWRCFKDFQGFWPQKW
jgi:hypothetical protein